MKTALIFQTLTVNNPFIQTQIKMNKVYPNAEAAIEGVAEAVALPEAGAVYLKVDKQHFDESALQKLKENI